MNKMSWVSNAMLAVFVGCVSCAAAQTAMNGTYYVGGSKADFSNISNAVDSLMQKGVSGPVVIQVASGIYGGFSICDTFPGSSTTNTVTFCSVADHCDSVIFNDTNAIVLSNTAYLHFERLSFKGILIGVKMDSSITDVEFHNCNISVPVMDNTDIRAVSYQGSLGGNMLDGVRFVGNVVNGGYYNFYLSYACGGSYDMLRGNGVTIDSNTIQNGVCYGVYAYYYGNYRSFSYNTLSNASNYNKTYYGLYSYYYKCWGRIEGNRIHLHSDSSAYGMYLYYYQNYQTVDTAYVCNNELLLSGSGALYGIFCYIPYGPVCLSNNSIYTNSTVWGCGLYLYNTQKWALGVPMVYNNLLVNGKNAGYAMYIEKSTYVSDSYSHMDYNNFYSEGSNLAYFGAAKTTLSGIMNTNGTVNQHSISVAPAWKDSGNSLEVNNGKRMIAPLRTGAEKDIYGALRSTTTAIGCYGIKTDSSDAALVGFLGVNDITSRICTPIKAIVRNLGYKNMDSATVTLYIDNVRQSPVQYTPAAGLAYQNTDTIVLGSYQLANGKHTFTAVVTMTNDANRINDTVTKTRVICDSALSGQFVIGSSANADYSFAQRNTLFTEINNCGVNGDITIALESGTYYGVIDLGEINPDAMESHHLTLTSVAGKSDSVTISYYGTVLTIGAANKHITVRDLTMVNTSSADNVVFLNNGCEDIALIHNVFYRDTASASTNYVISNPQTGGVIYGLDIIGNRIIGGHYGIFLHGCGAAVLNRNVVIDSNEIIAQRYCSISTHYCELRSVSHNTLRARTTSATDQFWQGINSEIDNVDSIIGNRIDATTHISINRGVGMYLNYMNYYNVTHSALVANNSISVKVDDKLSYSVYINYSRCNFYHNSIYTCGTSQELYAFYACSKSPYIITAKGNQIVAGNAQHAFWGQGGGVVTDYNNYYNGGGVELAKLNRRSCSTLSDIQTVGGMDIHSVSVAPTFMNPGENLRVKLNSEFVMPCLVSTDIVGTNRRVSTTTMGCYESDPNKLDAMLRDFDTTMLSSVSSPVSVTLFNMGSDTLKSATIAWTVNGVAQSSVNWTGLLAFGESEQIPLGNAAGTLAATNIIKAWINNPNNGKDNDVTNDTAFYKKYLCNGQIAAGIYTVGGTNPNFVDPNEMKDAIYTCGIAGPVTFKIRAGIYPPLKLNGPILGSSLTNTVTFTNDSGTVVFDGDTIAPGMTFKNVSHLVFHDLTFGNATNGLVGVQMEGSCTNVIIRQCNINASVTTNDITSRAFNFVNMSGSLDTEFPVEVRLTANNIAGGYYNIYLYNMCGSPIKMTASSMYIDSNVLRDACYAGAYIYDYSSLRSFSHNTVSSRYVQTKNNSSDYYGLYFYYNSNTGKVVNNRFHINCTGNGYGMHFYYFQNIPNYSTGPALIANNELRLFGKGMKYGIYFNTQFSRMEVHHNSIYASSDNSTSYGIYLESGTDTAYKTNFTRNLVVADGKGANYPLYFSKNNSAYYAPLYGLREWNNLYSAANVAYAGGAIRKTVSDFQSVTQQDSHSVCVKPVFIDVNDNLSCTNYSSLHCPMIDSVSVDINGDPRLDTTVMGCYAEPHYFLKVNANDTMMGKTFGMGLYVYSTTAKLTAMPSAHYHFLHWNDGDMTNPRFVTVNGDSSFTAVFAIDSHIVVLNVDSAIGCVAGGGSYAYMSQAVVMATPNYGYHFMQWNDGDTTNPRVLTLLGDTSFTASFAVNSYNLSVMSSDTVKGKVSGGGSYTYLSQAVVMATPDYGYYFVQWNDGDTTNPRNVTVTMDSSFIAMFAPNSYQLSVASNDTVQGRVFGEGTYRYLDTAMLRATAAEHHHFLHWSDGNMENPRYVTVCSDSSFTAVFAIDTHRLVVLSNDTAMGRVSEDGWYAYGTEVELTAVAADNHHFVSWNDGDTTNPRVITLLSDTSFMAFFAYNTSVREHTLPDGISIYGIDRHVVIVGAEGYEVKILNTIGQLIHRSVINEDVLRIRMPVKGVYFVKVGAFPPKKVLVY